MHRSLAALALCAALAPAALAHPLPYRSDLTTDQYRVAYCPQMATLAGAFVMTFDLGHDLTFVYGQINNMPDKQLGWIQRDTLKMLAGQLWSQGMTVSEALNFGLYACLEGAKAIDQPTD